VELCVLAVVLAIGARWKWRRVQVHHAGG